MTMIINKLLSDKQSLLKKMQFSPSYLNFIVMMAKYCWQKILLGYFSEARLFDFLVECIDHVMLEVCSLGLEVFEVLFNDTNDLS